MKMKKILNICLAAAVVCAAEGVSARTAVSYTHLTLPTICSV